MLSFKPIDDALAVAYVDGREIKRIFTDSGYSFSYTTKEDALAVRDYAVKEEVPLVYTDVPREALSELAGLFRHSRIDAISASGAFYRVAVESECDLFAEIDEITSGELSLTEIYDSDKEEYARLSRDLEGLRYWGYDYREDNSEPDAEYFLSEMRRERDMGAALSAAVRLRGRLVGEVLLYGFDYEGGAQIGVRLLPEYRGRGLGGVALELLFELAEAMGLISLYATVFVENEASVRLFSSYMDILRRTDDKIYFCLSAKEDE